MEGGSKDLRPERLADDLIVLFDLLYVERSNVPPVVVDHGRVPAIPDSHVAEIICYLPQVAS